MLHHEIGAAGVLVELAGPARADGAEPAAFAGLQDVPELGQNAGLAGARPKTCSARTGSIKTLRGAMEN